MVSRRDLVERGRRAAGVVGSDIKEGVAESHAAVRERREAREDEEEPAPAPPEEETYQEARRRILGGDDDGDGGDGESTRGRLASFVGGLAGAASRGRRGLASLGSAEATVRQRLAESDDDRLKRVREIRKRTKPLTDHVRVDESFLMAGTTADYDPGRGPGRIGHAPRPTARIQDDQTEGIMRYDLKFGGWGEGADEAADADDGGGMFAGFGMTFGGGDDGGPEEAEDGGGMFAGWGMKADEEWGW